MSRKRKSKADFLGLVPGARGFLTFVGVPYMADGTDAVFVGTHPGYNVTHYIFKTGAGWLISATERELALKTAIFAAEPARVKSRLKYHAA